MKYLVCVFAALAVAFPALAQEVHQDLQGIYRAKVLEVQATSTVTIPGTEVENPVQTIQVQILDGDREGEWVTFDNDYIQLEEGDVFYMDYMRTFEGQEFYLVREKDRTGALGILVALFIAVILAFGGWQGLRSLVSLGGSLLIIVYLLVPALAEGYSPIPISILIAALVLFCAIFFTHGFNMRSVIAFGGTMIAVCLTGLLAHFSIHVTDLTGFASEESVYLNFGTDGQLDFVGLLLAAIIIGALGVLDDIAVTQVAVVRELLSAGQKLAKQEVFVKAIRVGKEHVGALVNTLMLAYTGAALPLLLWFSLSESDALSILNREIFATELVRALVGSIGLVLTVPITTFLAVWILYGRHDRAESSNSHLH
jgi:uncharacterized membrane protein